VVADGAFGEKASVSDSHGSEEGASPRTGDERSSRLSVSTAGDERGADQTFQMEEWVCVSDFDVGMLTSTTANSDFDAQEGGSDVRGHDKYWLFTNLSNAKDPEEVQSCIDAVDLST
jgi:hypothetical protein